MRLYRGIKNQGILDGNTVLKSELCEIYLDEISALVGLVMD